MLLNFASLCPQVIPKATPIPATKHLLLQPLSLQLALLLLLLHFQMQL